MNSSKSLFFTIDEFISFNNNNNNNNICSILGCHIGPIPFNYLGVHIFSSTLKRWIFQPLTDRVKSNLASWKYKFP